MAGQDKTSPASQGLPVRSMGAVGFSAGCDVLNTPNNPKQIAELDNLALGHAATEYDHLIRTHAHSRIMVPIHFATLTQSSQGQAYLEKCRGHFSTKSDAMFFEVLALSDRHTECNFGSLVWQLHSAAIHLRDRVAIDRPDVVD